MRKPMLMRSTLSLAILACALAGCGGQRSGPGKLQFYASGGDMARQGLLSKDGWQLTFDHLYVTVTGVTAYQTDPPYDPIYSADIIRYKVSTALDGTYTVDLAAGSAEGPAVLVGEDPDAPAGAYNAISWRMAPAPAGDAAGYSMVMIGRAQKDGQAIDLAIQLDWKGGYQCGDFFVHGAGAAEKRGRLEAGGTADLEMTFAVDGIFGDGHVAAASILNQAALGFEPLAALAEGNKLDVDLNSLRSALSADAYQAFEQALTEMGHVGAGLCYYLGEQ